MASPSETNKVEQSALLRRHIPLRIVDYSVPFQLFDYGGLCELVRR